MDELKKSEKVPALIEIYDKINSELCEIEELEHGISAKINAIMFDTITGVDKPAPNNDSNSCVRALNYQADRLTLHKSKLRGLLNKLNDII